MKHLIDHAIPVGCNWADALLEFVSRNVYSKRIIGIPDELLHIPIGRNLENFWKICVSPRARVARSESKIARTMSFCIMICIVNFSMKNRNWRIKFNRKQLEEGKIEIWIILTMQWYQKHFFSNIFVSLKKAKRDRAVITGETGQLIIISL